MRMKENQNPTAYGSPTFGSKEVFERKVGGDNIKGIGDVSMVNRSGDIDSMRKGDRYGISDNACDLGKDSDSLSSDMHDKCEDSVKVEERTRCNGNDHGDSISQREGAFDLFEAIKDDFTDKNVLECDLPELEVMKDICVDNWTPEIKEEKDGKLFEPESLNFFSVGSSEIDSSKLVQAATEHSEENFLVCKKHPIQEADTQVLLEYFPDSSEDEGRKLVQPTDQIGAVTDCDSLLQKTPIEKAISAEAATSSSEAGGPKDNAQADRSQCLTNENSPAVNPGETSFSAVTYSDPVSFSRSLSHRSDASTASARSFAFPVLQSEWNSSPVRMAKADRRHFWKQKGWRSGVLCCRF